MTGRIFKQVWMGRCDATHRAQKRDTHLTHVCIKDFCGFAGMRIASRRQRHSQKGEILAFSEMLTSIALMVTA